MRYHFNRGAEADQTGDKERREEKREMSLRAAHLVHNFFPDNEMNDAIYSSASHADGKVQRQAARDLRP
ncbi:hypothetical protein F2P81_025866 [Scophthalmus maximus]|uniref:Uncharacterized protein n=1 Tax=Scophthalmus maximus TaxID=52904 RepID=A0A6A4RRM3_SCOMX|nr:hypothetical protein F2P81_025866 [Scophthalmus maximus]